MHIRRCTCGAASDLRRGVRPGVNGEEEAYVCVRCPVGGQFGPSVGLAGRDEAEAIAEAVASWNAMIGRLRPFDA